MNEHFDGEEWIDRHLRGELDDAEKELLAERLDLDKEFRQKFVEHIQWDSEVTEALRENSFKFYETTILATKNQSTEEEGRKIDSRRVMLAVSATIMIAFALGLLYQQARKSEPRSATNEVAAPPYSLEPSVARITGLSGSLIWTGDRGKIVEDIAIGTELAGGTIEGLAPDSWFELQFHDGSTIMITGTSLLTFADTGQKKLRLREGRLSAKVRPQPTGQPMLIHTRSALLKVLGTQFDVESDLSTTVLTVSEGQVNIKRLSDGSEVDVQAKHQVTTDSDLGLVPSPVPESIHKWKSQLHLKPESYGKWRPASAKRPATLKAIPLVPPDNPNVTLYLAGLSLDRPDGSPVVVLPNSKFVVRGSLARDARVYFGIRLTYPNGELAGMFRGDLLRNQPLASRDEEGEFEQVYRLGQFTIDPIVRDRQDELAASPEGLILGGVWMFTSSQEPSGLEIAEVELIPPEILSRDPENPTVPTGPNRVTEELPR